MTKSLRYSSRLCKGLADIQQHVGDGEPTLQYSRPVGEIAEWFLFEVFAPLGRQFPDIEDWPFDEKDWTPDFVHASDRSEALAAAKSIADEGHSFVSELHAIGLVPEEGLQKFIELTRACRRGVAELKGDVE